MQVPHNIRSQCGQNLHTDFVRKIHEFLTVKGHTSVDTRVPLSLVGAALAHLKPADNPAFKWSQLFAAHPSLFQMLDVHVPGKATIYAIPMQNQRHLPQGGPKVPAPSKKSPGLVPGSTAGPAWAAGLEQRSFSAKALLHRMKSFFSRHWQIFPMILMFSIILAAWALVSVNQATQTTLSAEKKAEAADQARQIAENKERLLNRMREEAEQAKADAEARGAAEAKTSIAAAQAQAAAADAAREIAESREKEHSKKRKEAEEKAADAQKAKSAAAAQAAAADAAREIAESREKEHSKKRKEAEEKAADAQKAKSAAAAQAAAADAAREIAESREKEHSKKRKEAEEEAADAQKAKSAAAAQAAAADAAREIAESRERLKNQKLEAAEKQAATAKKEADMAKQAKADSDAKAASAEKQRHLTEKKVARIMDNQWCGLSVCAYRQRAIEA
jgi:hypothetical protein